MKTLKQSAVLAALLGAGALMMTIPAISFAAAGEGWDAFNAGDGERISVSDKAYVGTALTSKPKQAFDILNLDKELPASGMGMSQVANPSGDTDAFRAGIY